MFKITRKEINWGRDKIILETGKIARQADGAVMVTCGETTLLCVVTYSKECDESKDFLPLTVVYQEKAYSAGKIPGGFFKREGKLSEREVLISRLIDRTIRPLFAEGYHNEVQVICTLLSYDHLHEPDILAMIGSSAALSICGVPFDGPAIGARVGIINDQFVLNPYVTERDDTKLDLVVGGTEKAILMVESEARELSEDKMLEAIDFAHNHFHQMAAGPATGAYLSIYILHLNYLLAMC
jgi:polyribonucleotide nucleotidyltransferase